MDDSLAYLSLSDVAGLIERREVSPVEVTQAALDRIERLNPRLNAFITVLPEQALATARQAEAEIARGDYRGPLHGIPYSMKDLVETAGILTTAGSPVYRDNVPTHDATVYRRLREAGGVLLGKNSMLEFAYGAAHPEFGLTANPWNTGYSAAGSSSGSGSAVAAGLGYASIGSDTGGSIRHPSAWNGIVGVKPTHGRVSLDGIIPLATSFDVAGPMTCTVRDAAIMLNVVAGYDPADPWSVDVPVPDYVARLDEPSRTYRIGFDREALQEGVDPEIVATVTRAVEVLRQLGNEIVPVTLPNPSRSNQTTATIILAEASDFHRDLFARHAELYSVPVRTKLQHGMEQRSIDYVAARRTRAAIRRAYDELLSGVDILVTPVSIENPKSLDEMREGLYRPAPESFDRQVNFTRAISLIGFPAVAAPCGTTELGLPIGLHFIGRRFDEATLLAIADRYERETGWTDRHPDL